MYAVVDGNPVDIIQCSCSYELNSIPKATLVLPVGRNTRTAALSASHMIAANTAIQVPVQLYISVLGGTGLGDEHAVVPIGEYKLFDGYVTGVGYKRQTASLSIALSLTHWLSDLNFSSTLSASSHPGNPYSLTFNASSLNADIDAGAGGSGLEPHWSGRTIAQTLASVEEVKEDLWGNVILKWFLALTKSDRLLAQSAAFGTAKNDAENGEAQAALNKFDGDKLTFDTPSGDLTIIARAIKEDISAAVNNGAGASNHFTAMANTTLWNKLVGDLSQRYMFSIIPYPEKAKVVPFIAGLQDTFNPRDDDYTIMSRDISYIDLNNYLPRPLRAIGILGGHSNIGGSDMRVGTASTTLQDVSGMFVGRDDGLVMYKMAPRWATEVGIQWTNALTTGGIGSPRASAFDPRAAEKPPLGTTDEIKRRQLFFANILNKYARAMYAQEVLKNRTGQVSGAVRFDIAPGSTISVEGQGDTFTEDGVIDVRYATVLRVTYYFDAESQAAGTSFRLGHIRTAKENEAVATSIDKHPLYTNKWIGSELVEKI